MSKLHAKLSPSAAHRWMACPGSVQLSEKAPPKESSTFADEGTAAHMLLEKCLLDAELPNKFLGETINGFTVTEEMASAVEIASTYVFRKRNDIGGLVEVETKLDLTKIHPDIWGTLDISIYKKGKRLVIVDFKYGVMPVQAQDNRQLLTYAVGAALKVDFDFEDTELVIIQPRAAHNDGPIRSWVVGRDYLLSWAPILGEAARLTEQSNAPLYRGSHCGYCPAVGICPKTNEAVDQALMVSTNQKVLSLPQINTLSDEQLSRLIEHQGMIEDFLAEAKRVALHRLKQGEKIEGLKLVAGRGRRVWADEKMAEQILTERLGDGAYKKDLLTVAQAEKVLPKKELEDLWVDVAGNETVAPASDRRKEIQPLGGTLQLNKSKGAI
jgi:CRISPR/Cas system-associated exonuclease Cas4 (RecB family)